MSVELRHLRSFLVVAEELNFSRAARRLHIAQPALSAQIATLERRLGCRLLERTTRRVELTAHGRMLLDDALEIVARVDAAVRKLEAASRGERGVLRIGFVAHGAGEIGGEILRRFAAAAPEVETQLVESATLEEIQRSVHARETDAAFSWLPLLFDDLAFEPIADEGLSVAMARGHALAAKATLTLADLGETPIVAPWDGVPFALLRPWLGEARPDGRRPDDLNATGLAECLATVASGRAVYCVPESVESFYARPDVVYRRVVDASPSLVVLAYRRDDPSPALATLLGVAREVVAAARVTAETLRD